MGTNEAGSTFTVLYVDPEPEHRQKVAAAVNAAGIRLRYVDDLGNLARGLHALKPQLLLIRAEVRAPLTARVLELLDGDPAFARVPVVCLCKDVSDDRYLRQLRTGIVGLLEEPFSPARHVPTLTTLQRGLATRSGTVAGRGDSRDLIGLVEHVRRTLRSGSVTIGPGRAEFERGILKGAEHAGRKGVEALLTLVSTPLSTWSFAEREPSPEDGVRELLESIGSPPDGTPILLVDDEESLGRLYATLWGRHGFEVQTAVDGFAGFDAALSCRIELVIADLDMPRMDGWGMLRRLRDDFRTRELPVVFLSNHDDYRDTLRALNSGARGYLAKSTRPDALAQQLREVLKERHALRGALEREPEVRLPVGKLGPQSTLREILRAGHSGVLEAHDDWALYRLTFVGGRPVHAFAQSGRHEATGPRAFNAFIASNGATGTYERGDGPPEETLSGELEELLARACALLNENEAKLREGLLVTASGMEVNDELYALYTRVGPRQWLETARLICEERLRPRDILKRVAASPLEVEETLRDLVRRGVVSLRS